MVWRFSLALPWLTVPPMPLAAKRLALEKRPMAYLSAAIVFVALLFVIPRVTILIAASTVLILLAVGAYVLASDAMEDSQKKRVKVSAYFNSTPCYGTESPLLVIVDNNSSRTVNLIRAKISARRPGRSGIVQSIEVRDDTIIRPKQSSRTCVSLPGIFTTPDGAQRSIALVAGIILTYEEMVWSAESVWPTFAR